ncbi:MAG TPA: hypothetical protein VMY37_08470 [Thermoguttaceae bacterium]|nr:hypothetical protein [Thermoguttaceae bacterium]
MRRTIFIASVILGHVLACPILPAGERTPADAPPAEQRWRLKVYVMPNDPDALLARVARDFPESTRLKERRVP